MNESSIWYLQTIIWLKLTEAQLSVWVRQYAWIEFPGIPWLTTTIHRRTERQGFEMSIGIKVSLISQDVSKVLLPPVPPCNCWCKGSANVIVHGHQGFDKVWKDWDAAMDLTPASAESGDNNYYLIKRFFIDTQVVVRIFFFFWS